ncbi:MULTISPECIES: ATP-dependent protease subunit HslV [unclassified Marinobacterium]|jgi:ATP-dependent HslUV protease, peptidase subunit HslV|uniref:ATP-dependent protease subunit HslV n=1 Tax=unclassified Marinobacterium TaxID=2644139 RepID=UPI00156905DC|nr:MULTISPECIES: ATP-dependent protease subunit HslV [unclassified Marinobacterium]NRP09007.1 ATP-dependent protease subunit HslV [Marinobacterium sp. xm-g-48]NRP35886.1 ATP-dependent protease subunit HslV [Marinobacterium sp. xm-d-579]NRP47627.1 ATP-dependent protease subunit HslV [Marinobacterium sp. xm-d-543]NRP59811.1 ATP-dependent protease subunit HslV [Marinobacterium sp. xm-d-564]NRP82462.1 ATP-dependent protease subunit HslV [Marinobacterium sp. xm-d-509]
MTTIVSVRRGDQVVVGGDGQVSLGNTVMKGSARKVNVIDKHKVITGFAGSTADAITLRDLFEQQLDKHQGNIVNAVIHLAREWRSDRVLRRLEALMLVANSEKTFLISGSGDVIEPEDGVIAIGSGGNYALAAARALVDNSELNARDIVEKSLQIAADICVFTNANLTIEQLESVA